MCGIIAILGLKSNKIRNYALNMMRTIRHRGPDCNGLFIHQNYALGHERLGIVDPEGGSQPLIDETGTIVLTINGEIYNYKKLKSLLGDFAPKQYKTGSDCEVILYLYKKYGAQFVKYLDGQYSFVLFNMKTNEFIIARDPIGITPLYIVSVGETTIVASEMKAITSILPDLSIQGQPQIECFPPGYFQLNKIRTQFYCPTWEPSNIKLDLLKNMLETAVNKRLMSDVPYGVLLSGGLDSSLIASIVSRKRSVEDKLITFSIGLKEAPDLIYAKKVAQFLQSDHHEFHFTVQEGIDVIPDVIWHIESYDTTTVRASIPMYLMARRIKALGIKMVLSGEGSDEIFGGYLYFKNASSSQEFHKETVRRVMNLHKADCLRANKSMMAWGVEPRVPFLDEDFLDVAMSIDPQQKMHSKIEKWILRQAFSVSPENEDPYIYLPDDILWRQKEQFSDGVGYKWIDELKKHAEQKVSDSAFATVDQKWPQNTPQTKEAYYYRYIFEKLFPPYAAQTVDYWIPTWGKNKDPSGRAQKQHISN